MEGKLWRVLDEGKSEGWEMTPMNYLLIPNEYCLTAGHNLSM